MPDIAIAASKIVLIDVAECNIGSPAAYFIRHIIPEDTIGNGGPGGVAMTKNPSSIATGLIGNDGTVGDHGCGIVLANNRAAQVCRIAGNDTVGDCG